MSVRKSAGSQGYRGIDRNQYVACIFQDVQELFF